jgi:hypothetical protein
MSTVLVSTYAGDQFPIRYLGDATGAAMDVDEVYPVDMGPTVLSEIWAPKLFARGLDTLELGASGKVTVTADDRRALEVGVSEITPEAGDAFDRVDMVFAEDGFRIGTPTQTVLAVDAGDITLAGADMDIVATGPLTLATSTLSATTAAAVDLIGDTVNVSTAKDLVVSSDGNPTLTVQKDRIVIQGDFEVTGAFKFASVQALETLRVTNNFIELSDGREQEVLGGAEGGRIGVRIDIAPNPANRADGNALDTYLRRFRTPDGADAFYTEGAFDAVKYDSASKVMYKGIVFNVNGGTAVSGARTQAARKEEPFWDIKGGAVRLTRVVPSAITKLVSKVSVSMRVTDAGELELVRHRTPLTFLDGKYQEGTPVAPRVLTRLGHVKG